MRIRQIPRRLLQDTVSYAPFLGNVRNGISWGPEVELTNVCISYSSRYGVSGKNQYSNSNAVLFYDCRHSNPTGMEFKERDAVTFKGRKMLVDQVIAPNWDREGQHHYELELIEPIRQKG